MMWGSLLVLALLTTINPVRLAIILLVLSRPRPMQNLLAYWVGAVLVGLATLFVPLMVLHATPTSASFARAFADPTASPTAQRTAIAIGAVLLAGAALTLVRSSLRQRAKVPIASGVGVPDESGNANASTLELHPDVPPILLRLLHPAQGGTTEGGSTVRLLLGRVRSAWQNGSPWIAFVLGLIVLPPLDGVIFALAIFVASGAGIAIQVGAVIAFMVGTLLVEEIILVSNLVAPAKTQTVLRRLHELAHAHKQTFVAAILAVVGISLVLRGMGGL